MPHDRERPRVALHTDVIDQLDPATRERVDILPIDADFDADTGHLDGVRFLAPGPGPQNRGIEARLPDLAQLEVFQSAAAGTDHVEAQMPASATLCSARGARDAPVAEWVLAALLATTSQLLACTPRRKWSQARVEDLADWTVLIVGMGSIGRTVERYLEPLGTRVVGVASRARDDLHGIDELDELLPQADAVVVLAPLTDQTDHMFGAEQLSRLRDGALFINAGRGPIVDTDALVDELSTDRIRAVLDVTDPEPLPDDHPLWRTPGLIGITPHIAGGSPAGHRNAARLAADQLTRWLDGESLRNVVTSP